jgi:hypothetical protein
MMYTSITNYNYPYSSIKYRVDLYGLSESIGCATYQEHMWYVTWSVMFRVAQPMSLNNCTFHDVWNW